jgi:hypothetical protein
MFRAGLLVIIRRINSVKTAIGIVMRLCWLAAGRIGMEHNTANHIMMYFYWSIPQNRFSKAQHKLPDDGPSGPKHVGANVGIF